MARETIAIDHQHEGWRQAERVVDVEAGAGVGQVAHGARDVLGADFLVFRGGRASVGPVVLGSGELRALRERIETAVYSSGNREVTLRGEDFGGALELVDAVAVFGGFAPFFAQSLIDITGSKLAPSYYVIGTALLSLAALIALRRALAEAGVAPR